MGACASSKSACRRLSPRTRPWSRPALLALWWSADDIVNGIRGDRVLGEWLSCAEDCSVGLCSWAGCRLLERWHGHEKGVLRVLPMPQLKGQSRRRP